VALACRQCLSASEACTTGAARFKSLRVNVAPTLQVDLPGARYLETHWRMFSLPKTNSFDRHWRHASATQRR